jgi:hypothetical protein
MSKPFNCTKCGRFIGCNDLEIGAAIYFIIPNFDCSSYEHKALCKKCNCLKFKFKKLITTRNY